MSESCAYLPAGKVADACRAIVVDVKQTRRAILLSIAKAKCRWWESVDKVLARLEDCDKEIAELHRVEDERVAKELQALASAAYRDDSTFRVYVSARDFGVIAKRYPEEN